MQGSFDSLYKLYMEYMAVSKLLSIDEKLSCQNEIKSDKIKTRTFRTPRKYSEDQVKIKKRV